MSARRIRGTRPTGGAVEALLVERVAPGLYDALARPAKKLTPGSTFTTEEGVEITVEDGAPYPMRRLRLHGDPELTALGEVPLPPYIHERIAQESRYDTVYAEAPDPKAKGSAAAPTAGLHFTPEILKEIDGRGVKLARVTLHVGLDTFRPVETEDLAEHEMHGETCEIGPESAEIINARTGKLIAVGTTSVRTVETFAGEDGIVTPGQTRADLFIRPDYEFRAVDAMFTNFHLPKTTMLAMISALAGYEEIRRAYEVALTERYRFLSFGDSMLII